MSAMSDLTSYFFADGAAADDRSADASLSPRLKALVITGLALAAWVPVLLPLFFILHR
jgi:hypothetical protein